MSPAHRQDLVDLIGERHSVRKYLPQTPAPELIDRLILAAASAPNAHNAQPWRFHILADPETRIALLVKMATRWAEDMQRDGLAEPLIVQRTNESLITLSQAPVLILACLDMSDMTTYPDELRNQAERIMAIQSVAAAIQNLLLAAWFQGLGGCWYCAPLFCPKLIQEELKIPPAHEPQAFITLGYPAGQEAKPRRKKIDEIRFRT